MKNIRAKSFLLTAALLIGFTGCGKNEVPDLTEEEMKMFGEFTAFTLMKYDASNRSRLVDLAELGLDGYDQTVSVPKQEESAAKPEEEDTEVPEASEPAGMDPVDETPVVNSPGETPADSYTVEEVLGLPEGVMLVYAGQEVCESYPEGEEAFFSLTATAGKKLLVLRFQITNTTKQEQTVDILNEQPMIRITVNETFSRNALSPTMLMDDMVCFKGDIPAGGSEEVTLLVEIDEEMAENITALSVNVSCEDKICYVKVL